ncbi:uncharacterized protein MONBRDRAFT_36570 [Monosiga brevicollis MX1]|uniref:MYND-type domain-containing protein n=1 Tax=Monosiga brevicollis TaxID=81824 RepID=A9UW51_MONBE|nr:uncharacterized protein MONBRDRAFT_36570 [Monosiga brevicollis MX1]EDQ90501.1 predicted protein [Monosiga brevicollis MX1]|eukprot:XP_001744552.1 hypothetical protein [Monosiga brevicollis MX1]
MLASTKAKRPSSTAPSHSGSPNTKRAKPPSTASSDAQDQSAATVDAGQTSPKTPRPPSTDPTAPSPNAVAAVQTSHGASPLAGPNMGPNNGLPRPPPGQPPAALAEHNRRFPGPTPASADTTPSPAAHLPKGIVLLKCSLPTCSNFEHRQSEFKVCEACRNAYRRTIPYCSKECQRKDWANHRLLCAHRSNSSKQQTPKTDLSAAVQGNTCRFLVDTAGIYLLDNNASVRGWEGPTKETLVEDSFTATAPDFPWASDRAPQTWYLPTEGCVYNRSASGLRLSGHGTCVLATHRADINFARQPLWLNVSRWRVNSNTAAWTWRSPANGDFVQVNCTQDKIRVFTQVNSSFAWRAMATADCGAWPCDLSILIEESNISITVNSTGLINARHGVTSSQFGDRTGNTRLELSLQSAVSGVVAAGVMRLGAFLPPNQGRAMLYPIPAFPEPNLSLPFPAQAIEMRLGFLDPTKAPFFADPSGATDSTTAWQRAIAAAFHFGYVLLAPGGQYRISDTLTLLQDECQSCNRRWRANIIRGFGNRSQPKTLFDIINRNGENDFQPNENMNQGLLDLHIVIEERNVGAIAVHARGAQGTGLENVTIDLGTDGFIGVRGASGSGGAHHSVTILGGAFGLDLRFAQPGPTVSSVTLANQRCAALLYSGLQVSMVDSVVEFTGSPTARPAFITSGNLVLNRVYLTGYLDLVNLTKSTSVIHLNASQGWTLVEEFAHSQTSPPAYDAVTKANVNLTHFGLLHGRTVPAYSSMTVHSGVAKPTASLFIPHGWTSTPSPREAEAYINVQDSPFEAAGDGLTDDWAALQQAINASAGRPVFLPRGIYALSRGLVVPEGTSLFGIAHHLTFIVPVFTLDERACFPLVTFGVNATGSKPSLCDDDGRIAGCPGPATFKANVSQVHVIGPHASGNFFTMHHEDSEVEPAYRHLLIEAGPLGRLGFYHLNTEHAMADANTHVRDNQARVDIYGLKSEGRYAVVWLERSCCVTLWGYGGNACPFPFNSSYPPGFADYPPSLIRVTDSPNCTLYNLVDYIGQGTLENKPVPCDAIDERILVYQRDTQMGTSYHSLQDDRPLVVQTSDVVSSDLRSMARFEGAGGLLALQPVTAVKAEVDSQGELQVSWRAPARGPTARQYSVQIRPLGATDWLVVGEPFGADASLRVKLTELKPETMYECTVVSHSIRGPGPISEPAQFQAPARRPQHTVEQLRCTGCSPSRIDLAWEQPQGYAGKLSYTVYYDRIGDPHESHERIVTDGCTLQLTHVFPATVYRIQVAVCTAAGEGPVTPMLNVTTQQNPADPRQVQASATTSQCTRPSKPVCAVSCKSARSHENKPACVDSCRRIFLSRCHGVIETAPAAPKRFFSRAKLESAVTQRSQHDTGAGSATKSGTQVAQSRSEPPRLPQSHLNEQFDALVQRAHIDTSLWVLHACCITRIWTIFIVRRKKPSAVYAAVVDKVGLVDSAHIDNHP